jgi:uncharacterized repeat protein (TIGR01451 family)
MKQKVLCVALAVLAAGLVLPGCCPEEEPVAMTPRVAPAPAPAPAPKPAPRPAPKPAPKPAPVPAGDPCRNVGIAETGKALPAGDRKCGVVFVEKSAPRMVFVGREFAYTLKLTNLTKDTLKGVVLTEKPSDNFKLSSADPKPAATTPVVQWNVGQLGPGQAKTFTLHGSAKAAGSLVGCSDVKFEIPQVCLAIQAVQPQLQIAKSAPAEVLLCDPIPMRIVVTNTGSGPACNVMVRDTLPAGLKTLDGQQAVAFKVGTLLPGQSREYTMQVKAAKPGPYVNRAEATADGGVMVASKPVTTTVRQPVLQVVKAGPAVRYVGRPATYTITVTNKGDGAARNTILADALPAGTSFVSASDKGTFARGAVTWSLGTIQPGDSKKVTVTLKMAAQGRVRNVAAATAYCAKGSGEAITTVKGIPAILLECVDLADPIEVGAQETYVITVTNQGSAIGTNIVVECTLPAEQQYVSATGPTKAAAKAQTVTFAPLATLAPKAKAVYRVVTKGTKAGDTRFKVTLKSDQMDTPAGETESTHIYSD